FGYLAKRFKITGFGKIKAGVAGDWFDNDAGDLSFVRGERCLYCLSIVVWQDNGVLCKGGRHTGAVGMPKGQRPRTCFDEQRISMTMITSLTLDDLVAFGEPAGQADGRHGGLGSGVAHSHLLHARHPGADHFRERYLEWVRNPK